MHAGGSSCVSAPRPYLGHYYNHHSTHCTTCKQSMHSSYLQHNMGSVTGSTPRYDKLAQEIEQELGSMDREAPRSEKGGRRSRNAVVLYVLTGFFGAVMLAAFCLIILDVKVQRRQFVPNREYFTCCCYWLITRSSSPSHLWLSTRTCRTDSVSLFHPPSKVRTVAVLFDEDPVFTKPSSPESDAAWDSLMPSE